MKKNKNKRGVRNYPIPNYQGRYRFINPIDRMVARQPKSNLTLEEYMQTDKYREFIENRNKGV